MDDFTKVIIQGVEQAQRDLRKFQQQEIRKQVRRANLEAAQAAVPFAQAEAPRRSGALAGDISASATASAGKLRAGKGGKKTGLYAGPIHFGWFRHHIRPNPFLQRGADKASSAIRAVYERAMNRAVNRING